MDKISFSDGIGLFGIILAIVLLVLDKAGKLRGGWLLGLLLMAGLMTMFLAIGNSWVLEGPPQWKLWRAALMFCVVGFLYSAGAIWISASKEGMRGELALSSVPVPHPDESSPTPHHSDVGVHENLRGDEGLVEVGETKSPIGQLSELGWTVRPGATEVQFEVAGRPIPDIRESAKYFSHLQKPFVLHFQSVKGITGLHELAGISGCRKIEINAGEFADISELRGFIHVTSLIISQTPIDGLSTVDLTPLSSLSGLREVNLFSSKFIDLTPISKLSKLRILNLKDTPIRDLSALKGLLSLESLDITGTGADSLLPLTGMEQLSELGVGGKQTPDLARLRSLGNLRALRIIDQSPVDLTAVSQLANLESLFIWGPPVLDLSSLGGLRKLRKLQISGLGFNTLSTVTGIEALGDLKELRELTLGSLQISDLAFVKRLTNLDELNISMMPVVSIEPLRALTSLKRVSLNITAVVDISPLLDLRALSSLSILRTPARADVLTQLERNGVKIQR
jgi:hypothetical protein